MREYMYYEVIAGTMLKVDPEKLFTKSRKGNVPLARQFCMLYRNKELKMNQADSGSRYDKDHATVVHAEKVIKNRSQTNRDFKRSWEFFIIKCKNERKRLQDLFVNIKEKTESSEFNIFLSELDKRHTMMMYQLYNFMNGSGDESNVLMNIKDYQADLSELYKILSRDAD